MRSDKFARLIIFSLGLLGLLLAGASSASAQCYVFTSSAAGITAMVNLTITSTMTQPSAGFGSLVVEYNGTGTYTFTIGQTTQVFSGPSQTGVFVSPAAGIPAITALIIAGKDSSGTSARQFSVALSATGDLLPTGLVSPLPPISAWVGGPTPNQFMLGAFSVTQLIQYFPIDGVGSCGGASPARTLGDPLDNPGCGCAGEPISVGTGNVFEQVADYSTVGPNKLSFTRYYNSLASSTTFATTLGSNWRSTYDRYLRLSASSVIAERADGQQLTFTLNGGAWTTDTDVDVKLTSSGSTWTLTDHDDTVETYTATGTNEALLQTIRPRNGYTQTLTYTGNQLTTVTDSFNRQLSFTYSNGLLQTVTTPDGVVLTYGYTGNLLTSISYPTSPVTSQTYVYENAAFPSALTGIVDENGNRYTTWTYDSTGRGLSSQHAGGADLTTVAYNSDGSATVTNPLGAQQVFKFTTLQGVPKVTEIDRLAAAGVPAAKFTFTYDGNGYLASKTDWNGTVTNYVNDVHGQPTTITQAAGTPQARTTTLTYLSNFHLPAKVVQPGVTTAFTYDSNGELLTTTGTDTTANTAPYSTGGQTRTWTYTWSNFLLASAKKPRTDVSAVTQYSYDSSGALTAITNALNQTTQISQHLPGGLPQTLVDPNGVTTNLTYDPRLRLLSSTTNTAAGPLTTSYSYDAAGNLLSTTLPDGSALTNTYDAAHRLTGVSDLFNQSLAYTLDTLGDQTLINVLDVNGNQQRTRSDSFDPLGRRVRDTGGAGQVTSFAYDSNSNLLNITDPLSHVTQRAFDPLNRLVKSTDPAQGVGAVSYDALSRPVTVTDPNGGVTTYVYDGFGEVIQRASPDTGTAVCRYDADGNLAQSVDAAGATVNYSYDALDRAISATYPADTAENVTYTYDQTGYGFGIGRLTTVSDAAGTLNRSYDERGNVLGETRVAGGVTLATTYTYDVASRVNSITYPSGWTIAYTRDSMGRVTAVSAQGTGGATPATVVSNVAYQSFGPVNGLTFGNGIAETRSFDLDYRITSLAYAGTSPVENLSYAYDAANDVLSIRDGVTAANSQTLAYDPLNRLTTAAGGYGSLSYTYDAVGNRLTDSAGGSTTTAYAYSAKSNQLATATANGVKQAIAYTKAGNINSFNPAAGAVTNLTYNQAGRLATVMAGSNPAANYTYDAFGQRLVRVGAVTGTTLFQYDLDGRLLEETDGQGNPLADYVYLNGMPVATITPSAGQVYFLHTDRLGAPQLATDSNQTVQWSAAYQPFGGMSTVPNGIVQDLRLPGQEYDVETGWYHNGLRDYVPGWGRYLESDPIGLAGGLNTYAYAGANPVNATDRTGTDAGDVVLVASPVVGLAIAFPQVSIPALFILAVVADIAENTIALATPPATITGGPNQVMCYSCFTSAEVAQIAANYRPPPVSGCTRAHPRDANFRSTESVTSAPPPLQVEDNTESEFGHPEPPEVQVPRPPNAPVWAQPTPLNPAQTLARQAGEW
jgi:RHS repeat-associated protein